MINNIDNQIQEIMTCSEKKCCKIGRHANIRCQLKKEALKSAFQYTTKKIKKLLVELKTVRQELKKIKQDDVTFRGKHLQECARRSLAGSSAKNKDGVIKQLKHIEQQIREARRVRRTLKGIRKGSLTHVLIPVRSEYLDKNEDPTFDHTVMDNI